MATLLKKRLWHRCFAVNVAKFLRTPPVAASETIYLHSKTTLLLINSIHLLFYSLEIQRRFIQTKYSTVSETVARRCSVKKIVLKHATTNFFKKETLTQKFSCEFCEILKDIFFQRTPPVDASDFFLLCLNRNDWQTFKSSNFRKRFLQYVSYSLLQMALIKVFYSIW